MRILEVPKWIGTSFMDDTLNKAIPTMRRMMQSLLLFVCFGTPSFAQQTTPSLQISADNSAASPISIGQDAASPSGRPVSVGGSSYHVGNENFPFVQTGFDRPYSQLATRMSCTDASPNLWAGYDAERAALAAQVMQHVDGLCDCGKNGHCSKLHAAPCESGCGGADCGTSGCTSGKCGSTKKIQVNRYKQPFSSLYGAPCAEPCNNKVKLGQRLHENRSQSSGCNTCNTMAQPSGCTSCNAGVVPACPAAPQYSPCASLLPQRQGELANKSLMAPSQMNR